MHVIDDSVETVHLYVVREEPKQPYTALPLLVAGLCLLAIVGLAVYSGEHPVYEHKTLTLPAQFLPPQTFQASQAIIPTGIKTYPATTAHGILTFTNGSIIAQVIPAGFRVQNVATDAAVYVPAGSADGYGIATVSAHALISGDARNFTTLAINQVVGSSVYIRNLSPFTGGEDSYSIRVITTQDRQTALDSARSVLTSQIAHIHDLPAHPCAEVVSSHASVMKVVMICQFVTFTPPPGAEVLSARVVGSRVLVHVKMVMISHPTAVPGK